MANQSPPKLLESSTAPISTRLFVVTLEDSLSHSMANDYDELGQVAPIGHTSPLCKSMQPSDGAHLDRFGVEGFDRDKSCALHREMIDNYIEKSTKIYALVRLTLMLPVCRGLNPRDCEARRSSRAHASPQVHSREAPWPVWLNNQRRLKLEYVSTPCLVSLAFEHSPASKPLQSSF